MFEKPVISSGLLESNMLSDFRYSDISLEAFLLTAFRTSGNNSECFVMLLAAACQFLSHTCLTKHLGCVRLTVFRNRNKWNRSYKSFVFTEIHMKIVKHLLQCYFRHIFIILVASKRQTYRFKSSLHVFLFRNRVNRTRP